MKLVCAHLLCILFFLTSCINNNNKAIQTKSRLNKKMYLPGLKFRDGCQEFICVTYVNGNCNSCINGLDKWQKIMNQYNGLVEFVFYLHGDLNSEISEKLKQEYPIIMDEENEYLNKNCININNRLLQTYLLDCDYKILLIGNPVDDNNIAKLYHKIVMEKRKI